MVCFFVKILCIVLTAACLVVFPDSPAEAGNGFSFSWQANPPADKITGYRLYYGARSRYSAGGYEYYIDLTSSQRCPAGGNGFGCEPLPADALSCEDLFRDNPKCTLYTLPGHVYLAMTAYNDWSESTYSHEVTNFPVGVSVLSSVYKLLLD